MSAGPFTETLYRAQFDNTRLFNIRVQPETLSLQIGGVTNSAPTGTPNVPIHVKITKSDKEYGIRPALVRFTWDATAPAGYDQDTVLTLPLLDGVIQAVAIIGATGTYLGIAIRVVDFLAEDTN